MQYMLLSDLHRMESYLSSILRSQQEDMEMTFSDDAASETSEHSDRMADVEESMRPLCEQFELQDQGKIYGMTARRYTLGIKPIKEWYDITIGWNEPAGNELITFYYPIISENGYQGNDSNFELSDVINALTEELKQITQGTLQPVEEEQEDMMNDIEDGINDLDIGPAKSDRHKPTR
jgi:hypothetical protein